MYRFIISLSGKMHKHIFHAGLLYQCKRRFSAYKNCRPSVHLHQGGRLYYIFLFSFFYGPLLSMQPLLRLRRQPPRLQTCRPVMNRAALVFLAAAGRRIVSVIGQKVLVVGCCEAMLSGNGFNRSVRISCFGLPIFYLSPGFTRFD